MNIILIGFMGTGKTRVSRTLQRMLGLSLFDVDEWITKTAGKTIPAIFEEEGEAGFRERESRALQEILAGEDRIVSGGGGIVLRPENVAAMKARGTVVWLTAEPRTVFWRVGHDKNRPNLNGRRSVAGIAALMREREAAYRAAADVAVATDRKTVRQVAEEIRERLGL